MIVRTSIDIDDELLAAAQAATGAATKKETVRLGLELLVRLDRPRDLLALRVALPWDGDLDQMRS